MVRAGASLKPYLIVFTASACGLIIEIVAGRILAPSIGVSLFTWTSIIGIVLAGISAGNYLGGLVADRFPSTTTLGLILLAGGVTSLAILPLVGPASDAFDTLPIIARIILLTAVLFLVPSLVLGMVTPVVVKLRLQDLARTGNVVGKIYAISTAGAIFGTFITGFVLIQWIGTRPIILIVALVLVAMALAFGNLWRVRIPSIALLAIFVSVGSYGFASGSLESECTRETNYFCIQVKERTLQSGEVVKTLTLDKLLHSYVSLEDPTLLVYSYERVFGEVATYVAQRNPSARVLFIGGGGYTMPRFIEVLYPQSTLEVIEIDPAVTDVTFDYLGLWRDTKIVTYNQDARMKVPKLQKGQYDLVIGDAFNDVSVPYHLTTLEFNEQVRQLLDSEGIYMVNVVDKLQSGRFLRAFVHTVQRTFPYVYVLHNTSRWDADERCTCVVAASLQPLTAEALQQASAAAGRGDAVTQFMPPEAFAAWLGSQENILLTDDYVPVDNLTLPLFLESR